MKHMDFVLIQVVQALQAVQAVQIKSSRPLGTSSQQTQLSTPLHLPPSSAHRSHPSAMPTISVDKADLYRRLEKEYSKLFFPQLITRWPSS